SRIALSTGPSQEPGHGASSGIGAGDAKGERGEKCRRGAALPPRGQWEDRVAEDRRLAEDLSSPRRKKHAIPAMDFGSSVRTRWRPVARWIRRRGRSKGRRWRRDDEMGPDLGPKRS